MFDCIKQVVGAGIILSADVGVGPIQGSTNSVALDIMREFGFPVLLILFFVWQGHTRESRMSARINVLEKFIEDQLLSTIKENAKAGRDHANALTGLVNELGRRPCVAMAEIRRIILEVKDEHDQKESAT
jgi:hypothetical protein